MSLGSDQLGKKSERTTKGLADGVEYKTDVYATIDELFHDDGEELVVSTRNKYFAEGAKKFLEDMNFTFLESTLSEPRLVISLINSNFKFISHMEDMVTIELPYDWDIMEKDVRNYVSSNPIVKKEKVEFHEENWNTPVSDQKEKDAIDGVKDWVKEIQRKVNIGSNEAADMARTYIRKMFHDKNETKYTAQGNPDLKLESGLYNNIEDLINKNGWKLQFESDYKKSVREYLRDATDNEDKDVEKNLLIDFGFEYIVDNIIFTPHRYWTNRMIEVKYKDQDQDNIESIHVDEKDFENQNQNPQTINRIQPTPIIEEEPTPTPTPTPEPYVSNNSTIVNGHKILRTYDTETPIFIVGSSINSSNTENEVFSLMSDFSSFSLNYDNEELEVETDGCVSILTVDEFKKWKSHIFECEVDVVFVPNMKGDIRIWAKDTKNNFTNNFDLCNIYDQLSDDFNVVVKIPNGSEVVEVNEMTIDIVLRKL